jgi:6-phospho-beta-glucosidase
VRLTILGGGGFRVPLVFGALLGDERTAGITEVVLHDTDPHRLQVIVAVLAQQTEEHRRQRGDAAAVAVRTEPDLAAAVRDADFVFAAVRVGGLHGRTVDERVALRHGVLGQETVGAGGIAYGLRTVPILTGIAQLVARLAPRAWFINFTNPAGLVTEAMRPYLGDRVIGICDSPSGLVRRAARAAGLDPALAGYDYVGLNHLGWLRSLLDQGRDVLPALLADDAALAGFEEGQLFGPSWLRALGSIPNEYLHYFYFRRETVAAASAGPTRGEFLTEQQSAFFLGAELTDALDRWRAVRVDRDATYLADSRSLAAGGVLHGAPSGVLDRDPDELAAGGYEQVAVRLIRALSGEEPALLILNVANGVTLAALDPAAVIEVGCTVDTSGAHPVPVAPLTDHQAGLICTVKAVERCVIRAAATGSALDALAAFALHPLVDSVSVATRLLADYRASLPELGYLTD